MELKAALEELKKNSKERKFDQTVDLIVNLKGIDIRKDNINAVISIPHRVKEKKVCGFLTKKNDLVRTITKPEFNKFKDKAALRELVNGFDLHIRPYHMPPLSRLIQGRLSRILTRAYEAQHPNRIFRR